MGDIKDNVRAWQEFNSLFSDNVLTEDSMIRQTARLRLLIATMRDRMPHQ